MIGNVSDGHILVIGSAGVDIIGRATVPIQAGTSSPGHVRISYGGVARNVAENLARLGLDVVLITAVGDDNPGQRLIADAAEIGINTDHTLLLSTRLTGAYVGILDERGGLHVALDDMQAVQSVTSEHLRERYELFKQAQAVFVDANLPEKSLSTAIGLARRAKVPIAADPTSVSLAPAFTDHLDKLWLITPNEAEADALCPHPVPHADPTRAIDAARHLVSEGVEIAIITMAEFGLGYATASGSGHVPAIKTEIIDPTGAGDALTAAVMFGLLNEIPIDESVLLGLSAASLTLRTPGTVVPKLSLELLYDQLR
jgi:pseudouridine kinase